MFRRNCFKGPLVALLLAICSTLGPSVPRVAAYDNHPQLFSFGPSGGPGGQPFKDGSIPEASKVDAVEVRCGRRVDGIQITYKDRNGEPRQLPWHGGGGGQHQAIRLDADEYITGISGWVGRDGTDTDRITSLTIYTNNLERISCGRGSGGIEFKYEVPPGYEIVGFFGRSGRELDAIGILVRKRN